MKTETIGVEGMTCGHCVEVVEKSVGQLTGINQIKVSLDDKNVSVNFDESQTTIEDIKGKIAEAGFETLN